MALGEAGPIEFLTDFILAGDPIKRGYGFLTAEFVQFCFSAAGVDGGGGEVPAFGEGFGFAGDEEGGGGVEKDGVPARALVFSR